MVVTEESKSSVKPNEILGQRFVICFFSISHINRNKVFSISLYGSFLDIQSFFTKVKRKIS